MELIKPESVQVTIVHRAYSVYLLSTINRSRCKYSYLHCNGVGCPAAQGYLRIRVSFGGGGGKTVRVSQYGYTFKMYL
jgi:hypothetical protein